MSHLGKYKVAGGFSISVFKGGKFPKAATSAEHVFGWEADEMQTSVPRHLLKTNMPAWTQFYSARSIT